MDYPKGFPAEAQAAVEQVKILASEEFDKDRARLADVPLHSYEMLTEFPKALRAYVVRVTLAFAEQACKLGRFKVWTAPKIDEEVHNFMAQVAAEADLEKCFHADGRPFNDFRFSSHRPNWIDTPERHQLKSLPQWKEYQRLLLEVTKIQSSARVPYRDSVPSSPATKLRAFREEARLTQEELAEKTKLSARTVKRHEGGRSNIRNSNLQAYEKALSDALGRKIHLA